MKIKLQMLILILSVVLLSGCQSMIFGRCGQNPCWSHYFLRSSCGMCMKDRCEAVCRSCTFNEVTCSACWTCVRDRPCVAHPEYNKWR